MNMVKILIACLSFVGVYAVVGTTGELSLRQDFFKDVMGMSEATFKKECIQGNNFYRYFDIEMDMCDRGLVLIPKKAGYQSVLLGEFEQCSIGDLQKACQGKALPGSGHFNVIDGFQTQSLSSFRRHVDISALQADPANEDAVFQVASNFNALEAVHADQNVDDQLLESYVHDMTQGPAASISAAPGLILRRYLVNYGKFCVVPGINNGNPIASWQQTHARPVNLLSEVKNQSLHVTPAGYARITGHGRVGVDGRLLEIGVVERPTEYDYLDICVGYHKNIQVSHGFMADSKNHENVLPLRQAPVINAQTINQVFTAALDLGNTNRDISDRDATQAWAQLFLNAAYEGTLRKAFIEGKKKVFLTLVGGGVFANKLSWIFNAINRMKDFIIDSGLEVTLIFYKSDTSAEHAHLRNNLQSLVTATGGGYKLLKDGEHFPHSKGGITLIQGDITKQVFDDQTCAAIVNAANPSMLGGGGIDGAIHKAAGPGLVEECRTLKTINGQRCQPGQARITGGHNLAPLRIIHTVGPDTRIAEQRNNREALLRAAYTNSLTLARDNGIKYIALPSISTGIYGYDIKQAASVALDTVINFMKKNPDAFEEVRFVTFSDSDFSVYQQQFEDFCNKHRPQSAY